MQKPPKTVSNAFVISKYYGFEGASIPEITKEDKELADKSEKVRHMNTEICLLWNTKFPF